MLKGILIKKCVLAVKYLIEWPGEQKTQMLSCVAPLDREKGGEGPMVTMSRIM